MDFVSINLYDIEQDTKDVISYISKENYNKTYKDIVLTLLDIIDSIESIKNELLKENN